MFYIRVFFHEHSRFTGMQGKGEAISFTPLNQFHPHHRHMGISWAITAESSLCTYPQLDLDGQPLISECKLLTTKLRLLINGKLQIISAKLQKNAIKNLKQISSNGVIKEKSLQKIITVPVVSYLILQKFEKGAFITRVNLPLEIYFQNINVISVKGSVLSIAS